MTAWGVAPAHGRLHFCGTCGAAIVFGEERRRGRVAEAEAVRITTAIQGHVRASPLCRSRGTFVGREIVACRCVRRVLLPREKGLFCARCEGLVSPDLAPASQSRVRSGGAR